MKKLITALLFILAIHKSKAQNELSINTGINYQTFIRSYPTTVAMPVLPGGINIKFNHYFNNHLSAFLDAGIMNKGFSWDFSLWGSAPTRVYVNIATYTGNIGAQYNLPIGRFILSPNAGLFYSHFNTIGSTNVNNATTTINTFSTYNLLQNEVGPFGGLNLDYKLTNHFFVGGFGRFSQGLNNLSTETGKNAHSKNLEMRLALTYRF